MNLPVVNMVWNPNPRVPLPKYNLMCLTRYHAQRVCDLTLQTIKYEDICINTERYAFCPDKEDYFLFVGKLTPEKGALEAVRICKELGVRLYVVGGLLPSDPKWYMWEVVRECDQKQIVFIGNASDDVKIKLMQKAKALIYPVDFRHAFDMAHWQAGVEALSCGTPLITYRLGCLKEVFIHGKHGFLVRDREEFKEAMQNIEDISPEECRRYAWRYDRYRIVENYLREVYKPVARGLRW